MKLNIPHEKRIEINASLQKINKGIYTSDSYTNYYFTYREIQKREGLADQFIFTPGEVEHQLLKEVKVQGEKLGCKFVTLLCDSALVEAIDQGKVLYIYYFTNSKPSTAIPDELIEKKHHPKIYGKTFQID